MYIDNDDFEKWMERLSKKLNDIGKDLKSFININIQTWYSLKKKNYSTIRIWRSC